MSCIESFQPLTVLLFLMWALLILLLWLSVITKTFPDFFQKGVRKDYIKPMEEQEPVRVQ